MPPVFITHITEKATSNNGKCASYSERVPYREFRKMYETRCVHLEVYSYEYIPVARIQTQIINTDFEQAPLSLC